MQSKSQKEANLMMLEMAANHLGPLCNDVVFLGGCTTALFITDPAAPDVRYTLDVDCIIDVITLSDYYLLAKRLSQQGFKKSLKEEVICRWHFDNLILDVMPTDEKILGFGNRWYKPAIEQAEKHTMNQKTEINVVTAPYFLATKIEAFKTRGKMDFYASHDFEDIISVLDGRKEITREIQSAERKLTSYLREFFSETLDNRGFHDALPGHFVPYGRLADDRIELLMNKLEQIRE